MLKNNAHIAREEPKKPQSFQGSIDHNAYDVTEGRPAVLGVKLGNATCAFAKHAARGQHLHNHTAGLARVRALTERLSANALCQHNMCAQHDKF